MSSASILSPTPSAANATRTGASAPSDTNTHIEFLALALPVLVIVIVAVVVLGAYRQRNSSLCHAWRRRINRRRYTAPRQLSNSTSRSVGHTTALRGQSSTMLVEELADINTDIWDADCDYFEEELHGGLDLPMHSTNDQNSLSSSSNSNLTCVCTISAEVHSEPQFDPQQESNDSGTLTLAERRGMAGLTLATCTDDDVSTQRLDISSSNITTPSYYSARSTSVPSLSSQNTNQSSESLSSSTMSVSEGDTAQEIVDVVQSDGFAVDTAAIPHSESSQFSLFDGHEGRGSHTDTELSITTPTRCEGDKSEPATPDVSRPEPEQMIIPLHELDGGFGSSVMWEDWEQELHTML